MTANGQLPASAVRVSAYCAHCKADVETDGSNRCPDCGAETLLESRGVRRLVSLAAVAQGPDGAETGGDSTAVAVAPKPPPAASEQTKVQPGQQPTVVLTATRASRAWSSARQNLLAVLESQEAAAMERFEAARAEVQRIRRERAAIARDCELIVIDAGPSEMARARVKSVTRTRAPRPRTGSGTWPVKTGKGFIRACVDCGTDDSDTRPHFSRGRCEPCYRAMQQKREQATDDTSN